MLFSMHASVMIFFVIIPLLDGRVRQLPDPAHDRAPGHGVPEAEHDVVLVHVAGLRLHPAASFFVDGGAAGAGWTSYPTLASVDMPAGEGFESPAAPNSGHGPDLLADRR